MEQPVVPDQEGEGQRLLSADSLSALTWGQGRAAKIDQRQLSAPKRYTGAERHF